MRQLKISSEKRTQRTDNISRYFNDVEKKPLLSPDEEFRIGMKVQQGDTAALEQLISANLRFVVSVAKQYSGTMVPLEELICQGNIGLCDAAKTYDPTRGFRFISYAVWHIRKEILSYLNSVNRTVKLPSNISTDMMRIRRINEEILQEEGRYGTAEEIHERTGKSGKLLTVDHIKKVLSVNTNNVPLESSELDDALSPIEWLTSDSNTAEFSERGDMDHTITLALSKLPEVKRDIVISRLGLFGREPDTISTIADRYERTPEWVRQNYEKSIKIMRGKLSGIKHKIVDY